MDQQVARVVRLRRPKQPGIRLTKRSVEALPVRPDREVFRWDSELPGFGVRVMPSGRRTYFVQYANRGGRTRRLVLGKHGVLTIDEARALARERLADVRKGRDPSAERHAARQALTVADLVDRFLDEYATAHVKPSTQGEYRALFKRRILPEFGPMKAENVAREDVLRLQQALRDVPYEANRTLALLSKLFNMAEAWRVRPDGTNPCRHVKRFTERKRERFLSEVELGRLGAVLAEAETTRTELPGVPAAIRLLALTGCRLGEILALRWQDVDAAAGVLRLADAKAGPRLVPLGSAALALLAELPQVSVHVVPGTQPDRPLSVSTLETAWARLRNRAKLANARLHDLRHTVGTYGGQAGLNAFMVRDMLGHKTLAMTGRYVEQDTDPLRAATDQVTGRIAAALNAPPATTHAAAPSPTPSGTGDPMDD